MTQDGGQVGAGGDFRSMIVLQSFPRPRPTTNPYLVMLGRSLEELPGVTVRNFSWRTALLSRFDVFHVHWPEILVSGRTPLRRLARRLLTLALIAKLTVTRTPIVRTVHNLERSTGSTRSERLIVSLLECRTTLRIRLNEETPEVPGRSSELILHGHYREWFAGYAASSTIPGRSAFVGLIRPYKGVEHLAAVFVDVPGDRSLSISGKPSSEAITRELEGAAIADPRISLDLRYVPDEAFVRAVTSAELVVLPYRELHNSGGVLASLSLDRPVLVPRNSVTNRLRDEVGAEWIFQFTGEIQASDIDQTLVAVARRRSGAMPDLTAREWADAGRRHLAAYRRARSLVRNSSGIEGARHQEASS